MKQHWFRATTLLVATGLCLLGGHHAQATATATSQLSFTNLLITPGLGTLLILSNWQASAFAQATTSSQFDSGGGARQASATGDYSFAHGEAIASSPLGLAVGGRASASASVPGQVVASDTATGRGALATVFTITGGSGPVNTLFSVSLIGSLSLSTDNYGELAEAESIFSLEVGGSPALFDWHFFSIGPSSTDGTAFGTVLNNALVLQFNTPYFLYLEADSEVRVSNVPEPAVPALVLCGLGLIGLGRRFKGGARFPGAGHGRLALWVLAGMSGAGFVGVARASYVGSEPPQICDTCGAPPNRTPGGNALTSLTEGNFREDYPVTSVKSDGRPVLQFDLTYNSYNADGSKASVDCGVGLGWTHSYNTFLFQQRGHFFRMGSDGRVTQYRLGAGGGYTADTGYFETLNPQPDGSLIITNKEQHWWRFASVPNTPFLVSGPVYRLTHLGDRNQNVSTLTYSNGLLVSITDHYGRSVTLGYTNGAHLAAVTDPAGRVGRIQYDAQFRLPTRLTDADGKVTRYSYNSLYQMTRKIDRDGRTWFYTYKSQKPFRVLDVNGQTVLALTNSNNWAVDRNVLAYNLRRQYLPSTVSKADGNGNVWRYSYDTNGYVTRILAPDGAVTSYSYDAAARNVAAITNANGAVTRYQYDARGNRTNVTDALGNVTTYTYDPTYNQVTNLTDANGRTTVYQYDASGNRIREIDPLNQTNSWTYDSRGNVTSFTDRRGFTTTYTYDTAGNRTNTTDALGNVTTYTYDAVGNLISQTDALGRTTSHAYDARDRRIGRTNALGGVTIYQYDALDRRVQETDPLGRTTRYEYDARGRLITRTNAAGGVSAHGYDGNDNRVATTDELGRVTTYAYDSRNRVIRETNALGGVTAYTYDGVGNELSHTDANGRTTTYTYDALNRRITATDVLGGVTRYDYASPGGPPCCSPTLGSSLVTRLEDANGKVTFYKYDALDRQVQVIRKNNDTNDVADLDDTITIYTYDAVGNRLSMTDPVGHTTIYSYDALSRQTSAINAAGDTTVTVYDAVGNRIRTTAPNGNTATNIYDSLNRVTTVYDEIGPVATYTYDAVGNRLTTTDPLGHTTTYTYDALDRRVTTTDALSQTTTATYDAVGNVITNVDRNGRVTAYAYDALNRRTTVTDALGNMTTTTYDAVGNVVSLTDANGNTTSYQYDGLNRRIREVYPDAPPNTRTNIYDAVGNLITRIDQKGQVTTYSYNDFYFLTNRAYAPSGANDASTYDLAGRMLSATRGGWVVTFAYDGAGRLTNITQNGQTLRHGYNIPGRARTNIYPSGRTIEYLYDARDRLVTVRDPALVGAVATYTYDADDRVVTRAYRNGTTATLAYNANHWITSLEHSNSLARIAGFGYAYDNEGNKLYEEKRHNPADSEAYGYDPVNRLTNYDVGTLVGPAIPAPVIAKTWNLDPLGNWTSVVSNSVPEVRTHNAANELTSLNVTNLLAYDDNGNLQQDPAYNYAYDEENRLIAVQRRSDLVIVGQYWYDALGRRIVKIANASGSPSTNVFIYDGARIVEELDGGGLTVATHTHGNYVDEVLTMDRAGQTYYYHPNALWSVAALTDGTGAVAERYTYDAYGLVTVLNASYAPLPLNPWGTPHSARTNAFRFTGREQDEEAGVYFYRGRHYDCDQGRFRQRDPIEETPGANLYQYVLGNPARWTDPSGLRIWTGTETVQWYFWDEWGWNFFNYYPAQWVRTGKTKVRLFVQTLDCCGLKWLKPEDISDRTWRGGHPGYWSKRDHSYAANATAEVAKQECDCVVNGVRRKVDGLKVTVAHRHSTEETAKITITGGVNAEVGAEGGKVGGQLGASIEFAPSKEGSWVKTYGLICPTGGADSRPRVTSLDPASDDSIHEYHSRDGAQWSGLSPSN